jgi:sortase A
VDTSAVDPVERSRRPVARRLARLAGSLLVAAGVLTIAWCLVVWQWQDPATAVYTWWQQRELDSTYSSAVDDFRLPVLPAPSQGPAVRHRIPVTTVAREYRAGLDVGAPVGRLHVPRLGLDVVIVNGTDESSLRKGPGRDLRTFMPGEHQLVYVAGHRTTFGAPFADIDAMRPGDRITVDVPYGAFRYRVTGHSIVEDTDLSVLRSHGREQLALQACHPRFFATQRYIVWASLEHVAIAPKLRDRVRAPGSA